MDNAVYLPFSGRGVRRARNQLERERLEWNSAVSSVLYFPEYVAASTCAELLELAGKFPEEPGRMFDGVGKRRNRVRRIQYGTGTRWAFMLLTRLFREANRRFRFQLSGYAEPIHTIDYGRSDHIDWHTDCGLRQTSTRKLVATILLSEPGAFAGGELELVAVNPPRQKRSIGDAVVFPAFLPHRVTPVTRGRRIVLAAWAHGPVFR